MAEIKNKIPFKFVLDYLHSLSITIKPMFGCHALYSNGKILLVLRKKSDHTDANGVWIATSKEYHISLKKELPTMSSVYILSNGKGETGWQMIREEEEDFEEAVIRLCQMIAQNDERIGKTPKPRKKK